MASNKILTNFGVGGTPASNTTVWNSPSQQITVTDATNPRSPRALIMTDQGVRLVVGGTAAGILKADLAAALITLEPSLAYPPFFQVQPASLTKPYNSNANIPTNAISELSLTYQWQLSTNQGANWVNISDTGVYTGSATNTVNISNVSGLNANWYRCVATQATTGVVTNSAVGILSVVPNITTQPANNAVVIPGAASFIVAATGTPTLTYQWQVLAYGTSNWVLLTNSGVYSNVTNNALNISNTAGLNNYQYRVQVLDGNSQPNISNAATLT